MSRLNTFFKELKLVELASVLAGPAVGMFFAELGAKVIKIENKTTGGDVTRKWRAPGEDLNNPFSAYYQQVNYGKESLLLNLKTTEDKKTVLELIKDADIVITNFPEDKAEKMGVAAQQLLELNPKLIFAQLSAFGPNSKRPAFDVVLQAEAGFLFMCGHPDGPPAKMPVALIDLLAAHQLKEGILMAIIHRMRTSEGSIIRTSLIEAAVSSLANQANNWLVANHIPQRMGSQHPNIAPYGDLFICKDEKALVLAAGTEKHFAKLCSILAVDELIEDPRFATNGVRVKNRNELLKVLEPKVQQWERTPLLQALEKAGVPAGAIRTMPEVFEIPEARAMIQKYQLPDGNEGTAIKSVAFQWGSASSPL